MIDFIFPEISEWYAAKKSLESGLIGKIVKMNVNWTFMSYDLKNQIKSWKTDIELGGGALSFYFSHVLYYLEYFLGRIKTIKSEFFSSEKSLNKGETGISMTVLFENGCVGNIFLDISSEKNHKHIITFVGESGSLVLQNTTNNFVDDFKLFHTRLNEINQVFPEQILNKFDDSEDPRVKIIVPIASRFINWCKTGNESRPNFQDGLRVQELIHTIRTSQNLTI